MSDPVLEELLSGAGRGDEELHDPREGDHDAVLKDVRLVQNSPGSKVSHAILVTYANLTDTEGREFTFDDRANVPTSESSDDVKRMFQQSLHSIGIVPYEDRRPYFADSDEQRQAFVEAYRTKVGASVPVKIFIDKNGWPRLRLRRVK